MSRSLAPGFLIASPPLGDPNFDRTVVALAMHGDEGALGFVVNRKADIRLGQILSLVGLQADPASRACAVLLGGPVERESGWILGRTTEATHEPGVPLSLGPSAELSRSQSALERLARDVRSLGADELDPEGRIVVLGYSGWGPGQLEREIASGAWLPVPFDPSLVFDVPIEDRWERACAMQGLSPGSLITMRPTGSA